MKNVIIAAIVFVLVIGASTLHAAPDPMSSLTKNINNFVQILRDPQYKSSTNRSKQTDAIWGVIRTTFDFDGVARIAVGRNWKKFTKKEQKEFSSAFATLLGTRYIDKIRDGYTNEQVNYISQELIGSNKAKVMTRVIMNKVEVPVNYSMWVRGGSWKVYDVIIEGVSMLHNFRSQFSKILMKETPAQLIEKVKAKTR